LKTGSLFQVKIAFSIKAGNFISPSEITHPMKTCLSILFCFLVNFTFAQKTDYDKKLKDLGVVLITPTKPMANYVKAVRTGNLIFLAGHGPNRADGTNITGKVGKDLTIEQGIEAARVAAISLLSTLKGEIGDFNAVKRIVKVNAWVNCHDDFTDQPKVINGCSDLLVAIFGEKGKHARAALGTNALPSNIAVEIEMIVEVE
jgi:enamine deaminase RidA (YjgF/YER057c/UK114 family)